MRAFLEWWWRNLLACLPAAWREAGAGDAYVVSLADPGRPAQARIAERKRGRVLATRALTAPRPPGATIALLAWPGAVLRRAVTLPLAVRDADLPRVLSYEMDRLTPFAAEEVAFGYRVLRRDRAAQTQAIALSLIPRAALNPVLDGLRDAGVVPSVIEDGEDRIPLAFARVRSRLVPRVMAGVCGVLALVAVGLPFVRQSLALSDADARVEALRPRVREAEALRRALAGDTQGGDVAAAEEAKVGDFLGVLATVTTLLPDDTYLNEFTLRQGRLGLSGQSASASRLLGLLAADPALHDPAFTAPVTRVEAPIQTLALMNAQAQGQPAPTEPAPQMDLFAIRADLVAR